MVVVPFSPAIPCNQHSVPLARLAILVLTRQEFIDSMPSLKITRFDASVLTVEPRGNDWPVLIFEKIEVETHTAATL